LILENGRVTGACRGGRTCLGQRAGVYSLNAGCKGENARSVERTQAGTARAVWSYECAG
jgi:hypothetical protein